MNIFSKIKKDHDEARDVMNDILATSGHAGEGRDEMFEKLKVAILSHAKSEEKTFYQAIKEHSQEWGQEVPNLKHDHEDVEHLFEEMENIEANSSLWWEKFGELRMGLLHHMDEEEKQIFKDMKKEIPTFEAAELGEQMDSLEEKAKDKLAAA